MAELKVVFHVSGRRMDVRVIEPPFPKGIDPDYIVQYEYSSKGKPQIWKNYLKRDGTARYDTLKGAKDAARRVHKRNNEV